MTRILTNIPAIRATHRLHANTAALTRSMQRLSTGLRINNGKDDPTGLIASETLRAEIRGVSQAMENSSRAINVISTADVALAEVSSMLLDLRALINDSANEGALSEDEIQANQLQIDSILDSIDRISNTTMFNGEKLLNGNFAYVLSGVDASKLLSVEVYGARIPSNSSKMEVTVEVTQSAQTAQLTWAASGLAADNPVSIQITGAKGSESFTFGGSASIEDMAYGISTFADLTGVSATASAGTLYFSSTDYGSEAFVTVDTLSGSFTVAGGETATTDHGRDPSVVVNGQEGAANGLEVQLRQKSLDLQLCLSPTFATTTNSPTTFGITGGGARFQVGPDINSDGQLNVGIPQINSSTLGDPVTGPLRTIRSGGTNSINGRHYAEAEAILKRAILQVAVLSGRLGGVQKDSLEPSIRAQQVAYENLKASESAIRDTDYAEEIAVMTRSQVLVQSTIVTLQMANQLPNNVLALLGG